MSIIKLNVGGVKFTTLKMTLDKHESFLSSLVSDRHNVIKDEEGYIFIDRNGEIFKYIMKWLRGYEIPFHKMENTELFNLYTDCKYYCISLADEIKSYYDIILSNIFYNINYNCRSGKKNINLNNDYISTYINIKKEDNSNYEFIVIFVMEYYDLCNRCILLEYNNDELTRLYYDYNKIYNQYIDKFINSESHYIIPLEYNKFINYYYIIKKNGYYSKPYTLYKLYKYDHNSNKKINISDSDDNLDIKIKNDVSINNCFY